MILNKLSSCVFMSVALSFSSSALAEDIVNNGSFEEHGPLNRGSWGTFTDIPFWKSGTVPFEIQRGSGVGIGAFDGQDKLELDANKNSTAYTELSTNIDESYVLKFQYSPRVEKRKTNTNKVSVWWDGKKLKTLSGSKRAWKDQSFIVKATSDVSQLAFKAEGKSDSFGGLIDKVEVFSTACFANNEIENGSFEEYGQLSHGNWGVFKNIPGWDVSSGWIEIQKGGVAGVNPVDGNAKTELDSHRNSTIQQHLNDLEVGERYQLTLKYSPRVANNKSTNRIKIWWNGKSVALLNAKKRGWVTKTFTVVASEYNTLKLAGAGKSDSLGGFIDDVQLHKLNCGTGGNTPPVAVDQTVNLDEDNEAEILLTANDAESQTLTFSVSEQPKHGTLTGNAPNLVYTPEANYNGQDSFTFIANDGQADSALATVNIDVSAVNDQPLAESQTLEINEDTNLQITLLGSDIDGDSLSFEINSSPQNGSLTGNAPNLIYTPANGFNGEDSFTYTANDGQLASEIVQVSITVLPVNDAPIALPQQLETNEDVALPLVLQGSDNDSSSLTYRIVTTPQNGVLSGTLPNVVYTPNVDFNGSDQFSYIVSDGSLDSAPANISVTVNSVNDAPIAVSSNVQTTEENAVDLVLSASDIENDALAYSIVEQPENGRLSGSGANVVYTPNDNFNGVDRLTYQANDGGLNSNIASITITVNSINDAPTAEAVAVETQEDTAVEVVLIGSDIDNDPLTYNITIQPQNGVLSGTSPNLVYTPNENFNGTDTFSYAVNDGEFDSATADVSITVNAVNDIPVAEDQSLSTAGNTAITIALSASDIDSNTLTYSLSTQAQNGVLALQGNQVLYTPNTNYAGQDSFTFTASDGETISVPATVLINVEEIVGTAPVINSTPSLLAMTGQDYRYTATIESNSEASTFSLLQSPSGATIDSLSGELAWSPNHEYATGIDSENSVCRASGGDRVNAGAGFADFAVIMDYSGSMRGEWEWVEALIPSLEAGLLAEDIGTDTPNYYGLMETSNRDTGDQLFMDGQLLNTYDKFVGLANTFRGSGAERGWSGISYVLDNYPLRDGSARNFILVTDEPEQSLSNSGLTYESVLASLEQGNVTLNAVLEIEIICEASNTPAIGMNAEGVAYVADGDGGYTYCTDPVLQPSEGNIEDAYVKLAFDTKGAVWSISQLRQGGAAAISFSKALQEIKIREIRDQLEDTLLADLSINNLEFSGQELSLDLRNRGLANSSVGELVIETSSDANTWQENERLSFEVLEPSTSQNFIRSLSLDDSAHYVRVTIVPEQTTTECVLDNHQALVAKIELQAENSFGNDSQTYWLSTQATDRSPVITSTSVSMASQNSQYQYDVVVDDNKGDKHLFSLSTAPIGMDIDPYSGVIVWRPTVGQIGTHEIAVEAKDLAGNTAVQRYQLEITTEGAIGDGPVFTESIVNRAFEANTQVTYVPELEVNNALTYQFELLTPTAECTLSNADTGEVVCDFSDELPLLRSLFIKAEDQLGRYSVQLLSINTAPQFISTPIETSASGRAYTYSLDAVDADKDEVSYTLLSFPEGMTVEKQTLNRGRIRWTIAVGREGEYPIEVSVSDTKAGISTQSYTLVVSENQPPIFSSTPVTEAVFGNDYRYVLKAEDIENDSMSYSLKNGPDGMSVSQSNLVWVPSSSQIGRHEVSVIATDPYGLEDEQSFVVVVADNTPPTINPVTDLTAITGHPYKYTIDASDPDDNKFSYQLMTFPTGMTLAITSSKATVNWTPTEAQVGEHPIVLQVADEFGNVSTQEFTILVLANQQPVITTAPLTKAVTLHPYSRLYRATDGDDSRFSLQYALVSGPEGMSMPSIQLQWTPNESQVGDFPVVVEVTDDSGGRSTQEFTVSVTPNLPPVFTTTPSNIAVVGNSYTYGERLRDPDGDSVSYSLLSAPQGVSLEGLYKNVVTWTPTVDQVGPQTIRLIASDSFGAQSEQTINVNVVNSLAFLQTFDNDSLQASQLYSQTIKAVTPDNSPVTYNLIEAPQGAFLSGDKVLWNTNGKQAGDYPISIEASTERNGVTESINASWMVTVTEKNALPVINSQALTVTTAAELYEYQVLVTDADNHALSYSLTGTATGMTIDENTGLVQWLPSAQQTSKYLVTIKVTDERGGSDTQQYFLDVNDRANTPPRFVSNAPLTLSLNNLYNYDVNAIDDENDTITYSLTTRPEGMTIDSTTGQIFWTPALSQVGDNTVVIEADDGLGGISTQSIVVNLGEVANTAPIISSAPITEAIADQLYSYALTISDADGDTLATSLPESPIGMVLDTTTQTLQWTPTLAQVGSHPVTISINDGDKSVEQSFTIVVSEPVFTATVSATPERINIGETTTIRVQASNATGEILRTLTVNGDSLALDSNGEATFTTDIAGVYNLVAEVSDSVETLTVKNTFEVRDPANVTPVSVSLSQPLANVDVTAPIEIVGDVEGTDLVSWRLFYFKQNTTNVLTLANGLGSTSGEALATFDPTLLRNGQYVIVLEATDLNGDKTETSATVSVEGTLKLGKFSFSVEDMSVELAGLPIRVTRTYDSRRKNELLDFGYGWSVAYQDMNIEESRDLGKDWQLNTYATGPFNLITNYCVEPTDSAPLVSITLPNGRVERFITGAIPQCNTVVPILSVQLGFTAVGDNQSTLIALDNNTGRLSNNNIVASNGSSILNPSRYRLTTREGYIYDLNEGFGIETVTDLNGNTLTYSNSGIVHSSGKSVSFVRDPDNRIVQIIDPQGNSIDYGYDANGDLTTMTQRDSSVTTYSYFGSICNSGSVSAGCHLLDEIIDPLGRSVVRNIYDDDGRLIAQEDQNGRRTEFAHDVDGRQTIETDRNGNITVSYFNERGNLISQVDALGNTSTSSYDVNDNKLTETDELGHVSTYTYNENNDRLSETDALGHTFSSLYNSRGQPTQMTDALNSVYTVEYDEQGNLVKRVDSEGNITLNTVNAQGLIESETDPLGNVTRYTYDAQGNKLTETDALGNVMTYTYNANNKVLTETRQRTVGTILTSETKSYTYDSRDRVIQVTDALGNTTRTEYDLAGQKTAMIDALGRRTSMTYDVYGNLLETTYPDGTSSTYTYDAENNRLSMTDRLGRVTTFVYDALNRQTRMIFPDGSSMQREYDAAGRMTAEIDENGHRMSYEYDEANRRITEIDALDNRRNFTYDAMNKVLSERDANANVTTYAYNSIAQRIETRFADTSTMLESFDPLNRRTQMTDQESNETLYSYDALGRLLSTTDALGQVTSFTYDEQGNKLTQTDAEGRTTLWTYDALGRVLSRTLPLGQVEQFVYDAMGNKTEHTDFNGNTHRYSYDVNDKQTQVDYADGRTETATYDAEGNRLTASITDANGTRNWTYVYDSRNRLTQELKPDGSTLDYVYDGVGNKTQKTTTTGIDSVTEEYQYDALNRLSQLEDSNNRITTYSYDPVGNRSIVTTANGNQTSYQYDTLNRLLGLLTRDSGGTVLLSYDYTLDRVGNRTQTIEANGRTTNAVYDVLYRLNSETISDAVNGDYTETHSYDAVGNRTESIISSGGINNTSTSYLYDDNDRLIQKGDIFYSYDDNGNTLTETVNTDVKTYIYNSQNQLISSDNGTDAAVYEYDAEGIRSRQSLNGTATDYLVDHNRPYAQVIRETTDNTAIHYTYGDDLVSQRNDNGDFYYHYDGLGSTRALSGATGGLTDQYDYTAYGEVLNQTGSTVNNYLFTGEQFDQTLNQYYLRARYYNPSNGRFTQMDRWMGEDQNPITLNKYLYGNANPINMTDPSGYFATAESISLLAVQLKETRNTVVKMHLIALQGVKGDYVGFMALQRATHKDGLKFAFAAIFPTAGAFESLYSDIKGLLK